MFVELVYNNGKSLKERVLWATVNVEENTVSYVLNENPHPLGNILTIHLDNVKSVHIGTDDELEQSAGYDDYAEYNHYMKYMFIKYDR